MPYNHYHKNTFNSCRNLSAILIPDPVKAPSAIQEQLPLIYQARN